MSDGRKIAAVAGALARAGLVSPWRDWAQFEAAEGQAQRLVDELRTAGYAIIHQHIEPRPGKVE